VHVPDAETAGSQGDPREQGLGRPPTPETELFVPAVDGGPQSADNGAAQHPSSDGSA
jgi:hypothetical protein